MHVKAPMKGICIQLISLLLSWTAIIFSIVALVGKAPAAAGDGALTIVSICVTLIVGVSVVDSLVVQKHGEKLRQLEKQIMELKTQKEELRKSQSETTENAYQVKMGVYVAWGLAMFQMEPISAFEQFQKVLKLALVDNKYVEDASKAVEFMEQLVPRIEEYIVKNDSYKQLLKIKIPDRTPEEIKVLSCYATFKDRIDGIYQKIADLAAEKQ